MCRTHNAFGSSSQEEDLPSKTPLARLNEALRLPVQCCTRSTGFQGPHPDSSRAQEELAGLLWALSSWGFTVQASHSWHEEQPRSQNFPSAPSHLRGDRGQLSWGRAKPWQLSWGSCAVYLAPSRADRKGFIKKEGNG